MTDDELLRYSRHILLPEIGIDGQERVRSSHAAIVGLGGLGSPVALYLAAAGVGRITLIDDDTVDLTNLQRQVAHGVERIGLAKVESAAVAMRAINPLIRIECDVRRVDAEALQALIETADVVIDCCDNFATRQAVNRACVARTKPLVSGAAIRFDGQLCVFDVRSAASPCYACIFAPDQVFEETRCAVLGVFGPVVGVIGTLQANEALKLLAGMEESGTADSIGRLLMFDGRRGRFESIDVRRDPACPVCSRRG
ncbi:MAG: molybdopterin-synthase adenylyltransferase MoeB [Variovorax sp.]